MVKWWLMSLQFLSMRICCHLSEYIKTGINYEEHPLLITLYAVFLVIHKSYIFFNYANYGMHSTNLLISYTFSSVFSPKSLTAQSVKCRIKPFSKIETFFCQKTSKSMFKTNESNNNFVNLSRLIKGKVASCLISNFLYLFRLKI